MITESLCAAVMFLSGIEKPDPWLVDWFRGGQPTAAGEYITEENALNCPAVKAAVSVLSESLAMLGIEIYREAKSGRRELAWDHPLYDTFRRAANPETPATTWRETTQNHLGIWGNGYSAIQRAGRGAPRWLLQKMPKRTKPFRNRDDGKLWYEFRDERGQMEEPLPASEVLHIKGLSLDGFVGKSIAQIIREAIGGNRAAERFANEVFRNGPTPQGFLKHPTQMSKNAYDRLTQSMNEESGHGKRHRFKILEEGVDPVFAQYNLSQLQMIDVRRFLLEEVARAYRITPYLLGDLTHGTMGSITELGRQFVVYTLAPWCARWTAEIDFKLLTGEFHSRFDFSAFLQGDHIARASYHRALFGIGVESINEIRAAEGKNPLDDPKADEHFVPLNMVPLGRAGEAAPAKPGDPVPKAPPVGDGKTPADPGPVGDRDPNDGLAASEHSQALAAAEAVLRETQLRLSRVAANAVLRTTSTPGRFLERMGVALARSAERYREGMRRPAENYVAAGGRLDPDMAVADWLDHVALEWQGAAYRDLLAAAECRPAELAARVAGVVESWHSSSLKTVL